MADYYKSGTYITENVGNNAISYAERMALGSQGKLYIPPFVTGGIEDVVLDDKIVFEEVEDGQLLSCSGLKELVQVSHHDKPIYITDNHHHALYFRYKALNDGLISPGATLLHIDQHADMNEPVARIDPDKQSDMDYIATYVNEQTQIASFIQPALKTGLFAECVQIRSEFALQEAVSKIKSFGPYVLDIDLDFFVSESDVSEKVALIQKLISGASLVTIATSPSFLDQKRALELLHTLLQ